MGLLTKYLEKKRENIIKPYVIGNILDIGCGPAKAINYSKVKNYTGVEPSEYTVINLSRRYPKGNFLKKDLEIDKIKLKERVNAVIMTAFLEHIKNYDNPILQSLNNLEDKGVILITTPTKFGHFIHRIGANLGLFSKEAAEDHKTILSKKDFIKIATKYNLNLKKFQYFELFCNQLVILEK